MEGKSRKSLSGTGLQEVARGTEVTCSPKSVQSWRWKIGKEGERVGRSGLEGSRERLLEADDERQKRKVAGTGRGGEVRTC